MAPTLPKPHRETARDLEQDAVRFPEQRGEILLEAAGQWKKAGETDRAVTLLSEVLTSGGLDAEYARYCLAEICFERDADTEAWTHLDALEHAGPCDAGPAGLVAELLERRGEHDAALRWFDLAISALGADELAAVGKPGPPALGWGMLFGRQRCRRELGLPADELDTAADVAEQNRLDFADRLERFAAGTSAGPVVIRMLVWQREEQERAARRWPGVFTPEVLGNHREIEDRLRGLCQEQHVTKAVLVPGTVEGFADYLDRTGDDPAEEQARLAYADQVYAQGRRISWPPGRNQPCWCGSVRKYKKCCGAPGSSR